MANRQVVINFLVGLGKRLEAEFGSDLSGFYLHGSLVNDEGRGFAETRSDVDLLFTTPLRNTQERVDFVLKLRLALKDLETSLRLLIPHREFYPIVSVCIATDFELREGIHKNRSNCSSPP